jgi:hypothetical protein
MAAARVDRDHARGRRAAAAVGARGDGALAAALAAIEATFSPAIRHSTFKRRVAALMMLEADHPEVRFRYQSLAERYAGANLDTAVVIVERLYRSETTCARAQCACGAAAAVRASPSCGLRNCVWSSAYCVATRRRAIPASLPRSSRTMAGNVSLNSWRRRRSERSAVPEVELSRVRRRSSSSQRYADIGKLISTAEPSHRGRRQNGPTPKCRRWVMS